MPSPAILILLLLLASPQEPASPRDAESIQVAAAAAPAGFDPAARLLAAGRDALGAGQLGSATTHLRAALQLAPGEMEIRNLLVRTLNDRGKGEEALALLDAMVPVPASAWMGVERGRALAAGGVPEEAEKVYRDALASYPGCGSARLELGRLLLAGGRLDAARLTLQPLLIAAPDEPAVLVLNARLLEAAGTKQQAIDFLRSALEREVGAGPLRLALARLLIEAGRAEDAWIAVEPLMDEGLDVATTLELARVALLADRRIDALALLGAALVLDPSHPEVVHDMLELVEDSHLLVSRLAQRRIDANLEDTYGWGELLEEYLAMDRCQEVLAALKDAPASVLQDLEVRRHEATALRRLGRSEEARARLEALSKGEVVETEIWYELGLLHYSDGRYEDAAQSFARAAVSDHTADAHYNRALCLRRLERHAEAATTFEAAAAARPTFLEAWLELGRECRFRLGDAERARRAFARYLELGGDDTEVRRWMKSKR